MTPKLTQLLLDRGFEAQDHPDGPMYRFDQADEEQPSVTVYDDGSVGLHDRHYVVGQTAPGDGDYIPLPRRIETAADLSWLLWVVAP